MAGGGDGIVDADHARDPTRCAAVDRSRRSHRQGLDQPARGAGCARRADRRTLFANAGRAHDNALANSNNDFAREKTMQLKDQAAIVTGGASGLGAATARRLAAHGAKIAVCDLNAKLAESVAAEINGVAGDCGVSDAVSATAAVATTFSAPGPAPA